MAIEYMGLKNIDGPLAVIDHLTGASNEELVTMSLPDGSKRLGKVVALEGDRAVIQVFEGTSGLSLVNTKTRLMGKPMTLALSREILGRTFDGVGRPIDSLGDYYADEVRDVNGSLINPVSRSYPNNFIQTGISSIDCLATLIRGQKLPIFSGDGLRTTIWRFRSRVRRRSRTKAERISSRSCSPQWALSTTLQTISEGRLKRAES